MIWADTKKESIEKGWYFLQPLAQKSGFNPDIFVKSLTFISGSIYENKALLEKDGHYAMMWQMQSGGFLPKTQRNLADNVLC